MNDFMNIWIILSSLCVPGVSGELMCLLICNCVLGILNYFRRVYLWNNKLDINYICYSG